MFVCLDLEIDEFGKRSMRDLKEGGSKIAVTDENKEEYVKLVCQVSSRGEKKNAQLLKKERV